MELKQIDAGLLQKAFLAGAKSLEAKKEWINELNVFPVPDGDTGTNMTMTIMSAAREVAALTNPSIGDISKAISSGSLRGARGNSGVILSQLFRGFTKVIKEEETLDVAVLAAAFEKATETAYKAVMKPKEGTILTVAKAMSEKAVAVAEETEDILEFAKIVLAEGEDTLNKTPEMLPVLKQAGVVDSGGQGLMQILRGVYDALCGKEVDYSIDVPKVTISKEHLSLDEIETADIKFGYCTEFIINIEKSFTEKDEEEVIEYLSSIGDSLVCVADDEVVKIHVHTNDPGLALQKALTYGSLSRIKIDNMREEHEERLIANASQIAKENEAKKAIQRAETKEQKEYAFITISAGEGLSEIFRGIGAEYIIEGGQTMNPSTEDILNAIEDSNAKTVYILPNNKNIILAAQQAASIVEDKEVYVIPTKTIPQGIAALISFMPENSGAENLEVLSEEIKHIKSAQVTYAVRDTVIDGYEIFEKDIMTIGDSGILAVEKEINDSVLSAMEKMIDDSSEILSLYYGEGVTEEEANALSDIISQKYPDVEIEVHFGGQPVYYYFISVE